MRRVVLTALVSVALVTAAGTLGATVVGDTVDRAPGNGSGAVTQDDGSGGPEPDQSTGGDDGELSAVEDLLQIAGPSTGGDDSGSDADTGSSDEGWVTGESESDSGGSPDGDDASAGMDPSDVDTDGDDVPNDREESVGTDPTEGDSDGDGLSDSRELELGTDPTEADTDDDGLPDDHELTIGTDPTEADSDGDSLSDSRELELGTDPTEADTDGDRLLDRWEVRGQTPSGAELPDADPLAKDVYVQFDYAKGADHQDEAFYDALAAEFAEMPVDNPDNSSGIDVHVRDGGSVNDSARFTGDNFWTLKERYYRPELRARAGVYHQVLVTRFSEEQVGYGEVGGRFSVVESGLRNETARRAVTHELLHNVVGRVEASGACDHDPRHYCAGGYLAPQFDPGEEQYLDDGLARQLERQGFAE